jgi:hypothetical protein
MLTPVITNDEYEGEIKDKATICNIPTLGGVELQNYTGADLTANDLNESVGQLRTDQARAFYFRVRNYDKLRSFIKNPEGNLLDQVKGRLSEASDAYVLGLHGDVAAGNRVGVDYTTGTVAVAASTGVVTGTGTTFTAAMVGRGFRAAGHTRWYRVRTFTSATSITIEDDFDDIATAYTGGAITAGAAYTIEAATALQVTKSNIYAQLEALAIKLNERKIPRENRWAVLPPAVASLVRQAPEYIPAVDKAYEDVVQRGFITMMAGFALYESVQYAGDSVNGWNVLAGHKSGITFGMAMTESEIEPFLRGNFGKAYKGLNVYGAKVVDERRKALASLFCRL